MSVRRLPDGRTPVLLSAHAGELVSVDARAIADYLERFPETTVDQVARQLRRTRRVRRHRAVLRAADRLELVDGLRALADGLEHPLIARSELSSAPRQAFVLPGQGVHWPGMGADPYLALPGYRAVADGCNSAFESAGIVSPLAYLTAADDSRAFTEIEVQGAQFVHAVALAEVWRSCGVVPDLTIGQSLGEVAAALIAGSITLPDAVAVVAARAGVVNRLPGCYAMATLGVGAEAARALIAATDGWVELSVVFSASTVAISGDRDAVLAIVDKVRADGRFAREITAGFPGHTSLLEPLRDEFLALLPSSEFAEAPVQFIGGATGEVVAPDTPFGEYWYANLRNTVRLDRAFESAIRCGARSFIELSAHPALLLSIGQVFEANLPEDPAVLVGSGRRDEPLVDALSANIVTAAVADRGYPWGDFDGAAADVGLRGFPNAPMRAIPLWAHPEPLPSMPNTALTIAVERWEQREPVRPVATAPRRVAVLDLGTDGVLARPLGAAIDEHPATERSAPRDAELVVVTAPPLDHVAADRAADVLAELVGDGLLDYPAEVGPHCQTVCLVTVGAEQVGPGDPVPSAGQAALAAMHRSVGIEYPDLVFSHLDLPSSDVTAGIVEALLACAGETALRRAVSGYARFERTLGDAPAAPEWPLDSGLLDEVVITGGAGAIGLHYARHLAERGARRIVLLSRHPADPATLAALAQRCGTAVVSPPCDITDAAQLSATAAEFAGSGASLIIHAAGRAVSGTSPVLTAAAAAENFAAKVAGLARIIELWPVRPDARMLLCSSVMGVWGGHGVVAYSAANRLLDVMAAQLRAAGRHCTAVKWGLWQPPSEGEPGRGIADTAEIAHIERSGLRQMTPRRAIEASLREHSADPLVFAADAARLRELLDGRQSRPRDARVITPADNATIADTVRTQLAAVLGVRRTGELNLEESLFDLGIDSMLAVDLRNRLKRMTGRTVSLATLMGEITGAELVEKLEGAHERPDTERKVEVSRD
ncbi:mycobactin polyketide synthase MbtD [Mycobacterium sp. 663a-19]|uniref:mycobactin polyketide synthase MbtD n=1 Tax=Mycobacterium sp. 663a-19 TaxID=2986148 RepID=UPI002D1F795C|nr:mycobactin polyketide synthase MbtD [Mycobacterium sp. 663a-19]MEB3983442.1 mycobactin polyketide synthase MbtD [Mycobacterium sp. 663a-19]